ncbi:protein kinase superfamily [Castilleja foliolosa]|uniref:Protein kinase superfamily n=1 Tax=Castilleja foliolosa TaxID=1961234 RepID=A0ABD3C166_9LAMI
MLLELITGRQPVSNDRSFMDDSLVDWVVRALEGDVFLSHLNEEMRQGLNTESSDYDTAQYNEDMRIF